MIAFLVGMLAISFVVHCILHRSEPSYPLYDGTISKRKYNLNRKVFIENYYKNKESTYQAKKFARENRIAFLRAKIKLDKAENKLKRKKFYTYVKNNICKIFRFIFYYL